MTDHLWHNNLVYVAMEFPIKLTKVYALNVQTKVWSDTKIVVMGSATGMAIDDDEILTLKICENKERGLNDFYRFPLK
jgi:hypothetical protein